MWAFDANPGYAVYGSLFAVGERESKINEASVVLCVVQSSNCSYSASVSGVL
jgi:hypothetical protein